MFGEGFCKRLGYSLDKRGLRLVERLGERFGERLGER
jgi:hypothetical protein